MNIRDKIRSAIGDLVKEGVWPNQSNVREVTKTGSNTTINEELNRWRDGVMQTLRGRAPEQPAWDGPLIQVFENLYSLLYEHVSRGFDGARQALTLERDEALERLNDATQAKAQAFQIVDEQVRLREASDQRLQEVLKALNAETGRREAAEFHSQEMSLECQRVREAAAETVRCAETKLEAERERMREELAGVRAECAMAVDKARVDAAERERLAYERLEGVRKSLYEETNNQREEYRRQLESANHAAATAQQQQELAQNSYRLKIADRDREVAKLEAATKLLERQFESADSDRRALATRVESLVIELAVLRNSLQGNVSSIHRENTEALSKYIVDWILEEMKRQDAGEDGLAIFDLLAELSENENLSRQLAVTGAANADVIRAAIIECGPQLNLMIENDRVHFVR
ncbi:hypothetical protein HA052_04755 [Chromobacterium haemolyticum]|uniref:KfrA N-terminal DNA-binding domain-containing protein n=1 Tax=Chromobacterium fluminis TaxID=3044269 RepID=A0ABX0L858_9NEIS|nr:DNA-binding protein [Chromobacterium haemolyticum]NHR04500.1 hypothetical protein [Chromobacterium haemolyticum]